MKANPSLNADVPPAWAAPTGGRRLACFVRAPMRIAAAIFGIAGTGYLGWVAWLVLAHEAHADTWLRGLFALALLVLGYALWHRLKGARLGGLIAAVVLAGAAIIMAVLLVLPDPPYALSLPNAWPIFGALLAVAIAFTVAAAIIATSKRAP